MNILLYVELGTLNILLNFFYLFLYLLNNPTLRELHQGNEKKILIFILIYLVQNF